MKFNIALLAGDGIQFVHISTEDMDWQHNIDDKVIVYLDIEPEMFRDVKNYNL